MDPSVCRPRRLPSRDKVSAPQPCATCATETHSQLFFLTGEKCHPTKPIRKNRCCVFFSGSMAPLVLTGRVATTVLSLFPWGVWPVALFLDQQKLSWQRIPRFERPRNVSCIISLLLWALDLTMMVPIFLMPPPSLATYIVRNLRFFFFFVFFGERRGNTWPFFETKKNW